MYQTSSIRFTQPCPTCGRRVEFRASLMGRNVACQHCKAEFVADPNYELVDRNDPSSRLMERVERALQAAPVMDTDSSLSAGIR